MLTIRQEQIDALAALRSREFENRALAHLQRWMPRHCALLGEAPMRQLVQRGWNQARRYALDAECTVLGYLDLMCVLGSGFDADPLLPWAAAILNEPQHDDPVERGDRLYDAAWDHIGRIMPDYRDAAGQPRTERLVTLLRESRSAPHDELDDAGFRVFATDLIDSFATYFPAKTALVGRERIEALAASARERALSHGLRSERGTRLVGTMMFVLGDGFDDDPLLPWIPPLLKAQEDEHRRVGCLFAAGAATLRSWWDLGDDVPH